MPLAQKAFGIVWHVLRPLKCSASFSPFCIVPKRLLHAATPCLHFRSRNAVQKLVTNPQGLFRYGLQFVSTGHRRYAHQEYTPNPRDVRDQGLMRVLDKQYVYQKLRQIALGGKYHQTHICVHILVKERGEKPNTRLYDALLLANTDPEYGSASEAANLLDEMANEGITPDAVTYHAVLRVLAVHPDYLLRSHIIEELRQRWFSLTRDGWHDLAAGLIRDRQIELAFDTIEQIRREGIRIESWLYDMMIYTLCDAEEFDAALNLMEYRISDGELSISATLWYYLLDTASRALHHAATLFAYRARVETFYLNPPAGMCVNILSTAARHADTYLATSVLRILGRRSGNPIQLHHYEALLETYVAADDIRTALTLLSIMTAAGHNPTEATTRPIYTYLCQSPQLLAKAVSILEDLREQGRQVPIQAANVVMQSCIFHHDLPAAVTIYKTLHKFGIDLNPDTASYNILFRGCAQATRKDLAMFLASEMVALKITPDALTYDRLMLVCLNSEDSIEDAWRYFEEMHALGWWPRDGTIMALARRACEQSDRRIWRLEKTSDGKGISRLRLQTLIRDHWQGGAEEARKELNRER